MYKEVSCTEEVLCIKNIGKKPQINEKWLQRQIYNKLKQGPEKCGEDSSTTKMKMTLSSSIGEENVKKIIKALCYINGRRGNENAGSEEYSMGCKFLYYHVGDILSEKYRDENFKENMEKIDAAIKANAHQLGKCFQDTYDGVEVFEASKILFDFKEDESTIKGQLQGQGRTRNCNAAYRAHWEKIQSTYETVRGKCMSRKESERCRKFKTLFPRYESTRILDLECKPVGTEAHKSRDQELEVISHPEDPEAKLQSTSSTKDATSTDITTTAISSTIATFIGIPMLSFFLYKYTSIFSGLRGNSPKRRRKIKSIKDNFDVLTDDSTEHSVDDSTVFSAPYTTVRSTRTGSTQQQRQRPNSRNIGYQRM